MVFTTYVDNILYQNYFIIYKLIPLRAFKLHNVAVTTTPS